MPLKPLSRSLAEPGGVQAHHLHDTGLELTSVTRRRPHQQQAAVICPASQASCSDGLVRRHQREVSPLSRRVISPEGSTLIRQITGRHSLPPSSSIRNLLGVPCGLLSLSREGYGLTTFHGCTTDGLGSASPPMARQRRQGNGEPPHLATYLFGSSLSAPLACLKSRRLSADHLSWPCHPPWPPTAVALAVVGSFRKRPGHPNRVRFPCPKSFAPSDYSGFTSWWGTSGRTLGHVLVVGQS